ncbi:alpha/beta fold hydrolase [Marinobacter salinexigens]|uniref:Alpha/beta fold hydrolase n=1 Tax=Marinobacter salinexigens TaxID=2919747 RepID=A0A5B0VN38_9GAMM|nr:alpha/beta hydrolase [Marinobacter salinexigens]KAA1176112.1 alpha/beta fold hydrolase [Marinobacter salinexigens]
MIETPLEFLSHGIICRGVLYTPDADAKNLPCIVMAHGFALTHDSGLAPFKEAFCDAGYAVFAFDYRHFGESDGEPRQALSPGKEIEDWLAATAFVRQLERIDADRICLWGTSFSGGLVVSAAAKDGHVQCTISQCPMMDGLASLLGVIGYAGLMQGLRLTYHATTDWIRRGLGMSPNYIASAAHPGELGMMTADDCQNGYVPLLAPNAPNKVAAGVSYAVPLFRPTSVASKVTCPALVLICDTDTVAPASAAVKAAAKMPKAEVLHYPVGHFDVYRGEPLAQSIKDQLAFLGRHLPTR